MGPLISGKRGTPSEDFIISNQPSASKSKRYFGCCCSPSRICKVFKYAIEEWVYLALLGLVMAAFSLLMDMAIAQLQEGHMSLYRQLRDNASWFIPFAVWTVYGAVVVCASALCAHFIAPQAIGSGIPEMKTVLRGIVLKEYLTVRTLIAKMISLSLSIGSGLPVGKEGPFVHIASVVANQLSRFVHGSKAVFENESRASEMLAAGCAVGVACTFSAPVGGVLFSIEVTAVYFAVRSYWRGFFAATCSATLFSVLQGLRRGKMSAFTDLLSLSVAAHYQTSFPIVNTYTSSELLFFAVMGLICGLAGALFVLLHRTVVLFLRRNKYVKIVLQKYWLVYPAFISLLISACTYPRGIGMYLGGEQAFSHTLSDFFVSCSWLDEPENPHGCGSLTGQNFTRTNWAGPNNDINIFHSLIAFQTVYFLLSIIASTLPIAAGIFMPVFVLGASFGRTVGELLRVLYPYGIVYGVMSTRVNPGMYAVAGAAAFCGAVTHTVSVAVIVFELTGQLVLLIPVMISVLIANAVCSYLQPSIYDSIIKIKHLPYLPDISHSSSMYHSLTAERFMTTPAAFIARDSTYGELQELISGMSHVRAFPLVENKKTMSLVGSISRSQLFKALQAKVGVKARQAEAAERIRRAISHVSKRYAVLGDVKLNARKSAIVPVGQKRNVTRCGNNPEFTVESVDDSAESLNIVPLQLVASVHNLLNIPTPSHVLSESAENPQSIMTLGRKRSRSSDLLDVPHLSDAHHSIGDVFRSITKIGKSKKETEFDMYGEERELWEKSVLRRTVDFSNIQLDPTPFQIQESISLFKVHSLFSLLGLKRAYVTKDGQLVGVISLLDLRNAIESVQSGKTPTRREGECQSEESPDLIGDDVDYLHPQLEVLTRPNTCADISDIFNGSQECLVDRPSIPVVEMNGQRSLPTSASAPYLSHEEDDGNTSSNKLATSPRFTLENQSTVSSVNSHKDDFSDDNPERSGHQRRSTMPSTLPDVRIVMPDDDKQESI